MFVYSVKGSTIKFFVALCLSLVVLVTLVIFVPTYDSGALPTGGDVNYSNIRSNEDRVGFLSQFGWTVNPQCVLEEEVSIPSDFDSVFLGYNELQKEQGLDLSRYKRKKVMHYRYEVTNYPDTDQAVYANILVYRGKVIGGDISSYENGGFTKIFDCPPSSDS